VPASSVGPLDWPSIRAPIWSPQTTASGGTTTRTGNNLKTPSIKADSTTLTDSPLPAAVDWRNRSGLNHITTPQDQGACNACWAFAVTALVEAQVRIEHGAWSKRSEDDVHDGVGAACESVGDAEETLAWVAGQGAMFANDTDTTSQAPPGIADWPCDPYRDTEHGSVHCADREGRATRIPFYQELGVVEDQKRWLDQYGPLVATFVLHVDLDGWKPNATNTGVYKWDRVSGTNGNHIALVVGYDDVKQAWIIKNSWGKGWGDNGFVHFA
jgi:C1A family cysteine protease